MLRRVAPAVCPRARSNLEVGGPQPGQRLPEGRLVLAETAHEAIDQRAERVDGQGGLVELRCLGGEVERGELVEAHGVVGHDHGGRRPQQLTADLLHLVLHGLDLGLLLRGEVVPPDGVVRPGAAFGAVTASAARRRDGVVPPRGPEAYRRTRVVVTRNMAVPYAPQLKRKRGPGSHLTTDGALRSTSSATRLCRVDRRTSASPASALVVFEG